MAVYSSTLRYTGLSGIDTESMVRSLMNAESIKYNNLKAQTQKIEWKQDAYRSVSDKLKSFQSTFLDIVSTSSLRSDKTFSALTTSIKSNGTVSSMISVKTSGSTVAGKHTLKVNSLASKDAYVSNKVVGGTISGDKDIAEVIEGLKNAVDENGENPADSVSFRLNFDGVVKEISLSRDEINGLTSGGTGTTLRKLLNDKIKDAVGEGKIRIDINDGNLKLVSLQGGHSVTMGLPTDGSANFLEIMGTKDTGYAQADDIMEKTLGDLGLALTGDRTITINNKSFNISADTKVSALISEVNKIGGFKLSYDNFAQGFKLESNQTGKASEIRWGNDADSQAVFAVLGFDTSNASRLSQAKDAEFEFNGVKTTRATNSFTMSNMTISLDEAGAIGQTFDIELKRDTQSTVDTIKKFVDAYNALIGEMNGMTNQKRAKRDSYDYYEPLTEEQKEAMTEEQITKWEGKAKEGILNRDDILGGITSSMRSWLYESVDLGGGKKISLYEIGITTSTRTQDQGKLIIDEAKLQKAIEERSDDVLKLFTKDSEYAYNDKKNKRTRMQQEGIANRLNDIINDAISGSGTIAQRAGIKGQLSEFTNDLYYKLKDQNESLSEMLKYLTRKETNYYAMFSKLETAMTKANAQASYMASQLGL